MAKKNVHWLNLEEEFNSIQNLILNSHKIVLTNQHRMDGDAYWSMMGFYFILEKLWKNVIAVNEFLPAPEFNFLDMHNIVKQEFDIEGFAPDIIISFDAASLSQLWWTYERNKRAFINSTFIVIDHHETNPIFWDINYIDVHKSSTCEIVYWLLLELWHENLIDSNIATALLMWIITDTNSFYNTNSSPEALDTSARLLELWARHQDIIVNLFKKKSFAKMKLWWNILENLRDISDGKIVWNTIQKSTFIEHNATPDDLTWFIDEFLTAIDWAKIVFILYERPDWCIKWSFRSKSDTYNVAKFCEQFWWWWHPRAAWFIASWVSLFEVENNIIDKLRKFIKSNWKIRSFF